MFLPGTGQLLQSSKRTESGFMSNFLVVSFDREEVSRVQTVVFVGEWPEFIAWHPHKQLLPATSKIKQLLSDHVKQLLQLESTTAPVTTRRATRSQYFFHWQLLLDAASNSSSTKVQGMLPGGSTLIWLVTWVYLLVVLAPAQVVKVCLLKVQPHLYR